MEVGFPLVAAAAAAALALALGWRLGGRFAPARGPREAEEMRQRLLATTSELQRREAESRAVLEGIVEGVLAVDGERRITYLNPQAARLLGVREDEARGRFCGDLLRPEPAADRPCAERCPIVHARGRGTTRALERLRPAGAAPRTAVVTSAPPSGRFQVVVLRDETQEETGRRERDAILANLTHELKTPLAAQLASVELLRDGLGERISLDQARELVASLARSTLRLLGLVENLLISARLETGEWAMRSEAVDLAAVCREAAGVLEPLFDQRHQRVEWELAQLPAVPGDRTQLLQVALNLLGNANKFAPAESAIRIGGRPENGAVLLWVEDRGPGLQPGDERLIFELFRRAASGGAAKGAGLGLWIVKQVVERHGGTVEAANAAAGGARFSVRLPVGRA
jgi:signal transduction histidine kinase